MKNDQELRIYHFDDEPDEVDWIPEVIFNQLWNNYPDVIDEESYDHDPSPEKVTVQFKLNFDNGCVGIRYDLYCEPSAFENAFGPNKWDIVLLDLISELPNGKLEPVGGKLFERALDTELDLSRLYILTAYPKEIEDFNKNETYDIADQHLIAKPPDAHYLGEKLLNLIQQALKEWKYI